MQRPSSMERDIYVKDFFTGVEVSRSRLTKGRYDKGKEQGNFDPYDYRKRVMLRDLRSHKEQTSD